MSCHQYPDQLAFLLPKQLKAARWRCSPNSLFFPPAEQTTPYTDPLTSARPSGTETLPFEHQLLLCGQGVLSFCKPKPKPQPSTISRIIEQPSGGIASPRPLRAETTEELLVSEEIAALGSAVTMVSGVAVIFGLIFAAAFSMKSACDRFNYNDCSGLMQ